MFDGSSISGNVYQFWAVLLSNPNLPPVNINTPLGSLADQHCSTNEMTPGEADPIFDSSEATVPVGGTITAAWDGEIRAAKMDGSGQTLRFMHTYTDNREAANFSAQYGIGSVFQSGDFYLVASYWGGTLGNTNGTSDICTYGTGGNCRSDAFLVDLRDVITGGPSLSETLITIGTITVNRIATNGREQVETMTSTHSATAVKLNTNARGCSENLAVLDQLSASSIAVGHVFVSHCQ